MKTKKLGILFLVVVVMLLVSTIISTDTLKEIESRNLNCDYESDYKTSDYWEIPSQITIDDTSPGSNWTKTNETYSWINGAGTWENPYIIENVTFNPGGSGSAITIQSSNVPFIIRNCTIRNTGSSSEASGIKLINVNNSRLLGNNFLDINLMGIYLKDSCINNTISDNILFENYPDESPFIEYGIYLYNQCNNNTIKNNKLHAIGRSYLGDRAGIQLEDNCDYNKIENNLINQSKHGIYLLNDCDENTLFNNSLIYNVENGIYLKTNSDANKIYNNTLDFNKIGIQVGALSDFNNYITIHNNKLHNNSGYGISIDDSRYSNIWENELYGCGFRIELKNITYHRELTLSQNNTVNGQPVYYYVEKSGLDSSDFPNAGQIILIDCNHTNIANLDLSFCSIGIYISKAADGGYIGSSYNHTISNITLQGNTEGIHLRLSYNISISNITAKTNTNAIFLYSCHDCTIDNCTLTENTDYGLDLYDCYSNNIINNHIQFNTGDGLYLEWYSDNNKIINNTISNNTNDGVSFIYVSNNYVFGNNISNNEGNGIYIYYSSESNIISNNTISNNEKNGIYLYGTASYCDKNNITLNFIQFNGENGIYLNDNCDKNNISLNIIRYNEDHGIYISTSSKSNIIFNNTISYNQEKGLYIGEVCNYNYVFDNIISHNEDDGVFIQGTYINITKNDIYANSHRGLYLSSSANNCIIWNNYFYINGMNAIDDGNINAWDNGSLGNYWDDYKGGDNNGDGIGDTPYIIPGTAGSKDNYPIWGIPLSISTSDDDNNDKTPPKNDLTIYFIGGIIIAAIVAAYCALSMYSKKHPLGKSKIKDEPLLVKLSDEKDTSKIQTVKTETPETKDISKEIQSAEETIKIIDQIDHFSIQDKIKFKSKNIDEIYDDFIKKTPTINNYLESDLSIDEIPDGEKLIATIIDEEDLRKIDLINLPEQDKKAFIMEFLSMNVKDRKRVLDEMLSDLD